MKKLKIIIQEKTLSNLDTLTSFDVFIDDKKVKFENVEIKLSSNNFFNTGEKANMKLKY